MIIPKPGVEPVAQRPIRLSGERRDAMIDCTNDWKRQKKVSPAHPNVGWCSPGFVIPKRLKNAWRGLVDLRKVNDSILSDNYPIPLIEDIIQRQGKNHLWSTLDLKDAFSQIPLHPDSRPFTTTSTPLELVE